MFNSWLDVYPDNLFSLVIILLLYKLQFHLSVFLFYFQFHSFIHVDMQSLLNRAKKLYPDSYVIHEGSLAGFLILVKNTNWRTVQWRM